MDIRLLREFKNRWQAVAEIEVEERRTASMKNPWEQLNYLYLLGQAMSLSRDESQEQVVWNRWQRLKSTR